MLAIVVAFLVLRTPDTDRDAMIAKYGGAAKPLLPELRQLEKEKTGAYQAPYYFSEAAESY